ncbi:Uncharacterised protein [Legionella donaldsonii]|uniref:Uncharacterized protein n=1 Tax=Legionella donaldsonii TaxID=45060 RepID=A0A378J691_9GAMM|nr:Uncharacterised protein [Legionella donaldsonii]
MILLFTAPVSSVSLDYDTDTVHKQAGSHFNKGRHNS